VAPLAKIRNVLSRSSESASDTISGHETGDLVYFLIIYDTATEDIVALKEFSRASDAEAAYFAAEREYRDDQLQVVLFGADSIDSVRATHPHYFREEGGETIEFLAPTPALLPGH
jgi:hypothetical protein